MPKKTPFPHKRWKIVYDDLITAILQGKTHTQAGEQVGMTSRHISRLMRWPVFTREFRRRRALIIEDADAWIQAAHTTAVARQLEIMSNLNRPYIIEYKGRKGETKYKTVQPNFHLVAQVAEQVRRAGHERHDKWEANDLLQRVEALERDRAKRRKE